MFSVWLLGCLVLPSPIDLPPVIQQFVRRLHRHTAKIGDKMSAIGVTCDVALGTFPGILSAKRKHITAVTAPIRTEVRERFETVRNPVVDLFFVSILNP